MSGALERIRDALANATPGPWHAAGFAGIDRHAFYLLADFYDEHGKRHMDPVTGKSVHSDDARLIQELRNHAEQLLDVVDAARERRSVDTCEWCYDAECTGAGICPCDYACHDAEYRAKVALDAALARLEDVQAVAS